MKNISRWGKTNPILSRYIIGLSHILLVTNAILQGMLCYLLNITTPTWCTLILANLFFVVYLFYPVKGSTRGWFRYSYVRQKVSDFILVLTYSLIIVSGVNQFCSRPIDLPDTAKVGARFMVYRPNPTGPVAKTAKKEFKEKIKQFRTILKSRLGELKKNHQERQSGANTTVKILLVILTVALALGLAFLISALACNLSCSGQEGLAIIVLILGWGAIIWLAIIAIKNIFKKRRLVSKLVR